MDDPRRRIRLLLVDDSLFFREALRRELAKDRRFEVVALANDPYEARDQIMLFDPDVMVSDINMPRMNGVDFIRRLMPQYPIPIIVVSSNTEYLGEAVKAGALAGVAKPGANGGPDFAGFVREVSDKIAFAATRGRRAAELRPAAVGREADVTGPVAPVAARAEPAVPRKATGIALIAIGASTGGTDAIAKVVSELPAGLPGIVIVQHMPADFTGMFAQRLNRICAFPVTEARTGDRVLPSSALVAPGNFQFRVVRGADGYSVLIKSGEKFGGHCPSVDVLFSSVAQSAGPHAIGVILTGMGQDGANGLLEMRRAGAKTLGQDEKTCVVYGMPKVAYEIGAVGQQLPLAHISSRIVQLM